MKREDTPSSAMFAYLKSRGISNRAAAEVLLDTRRTFDGNMMQSRIEDRSQLSRRIIHVRPGELPVNLFSNFSTSCTTINSLIINKRMERSRELDRAAAAQAELADLQATAHPAMAAALRACVIDDTPYLNTASYIDRLTLENARDELALHVMLFVVTGCTGDPSYAYSTVERYVEDELGTSFSTAETVVSSLEAPASETEDLNIGLVRVISGGIKSGSKVYALNPEGTDIGAFPSSPDMITNVDNDVSRKHAHVWKENGRWFIQGLKSTNGTFIITGSEKREHVVEPPRSKRTASYEPQPVEIFPTDTICMGQTTRFMVLPIFE